MSILLVTDKEDFNTMKELLELSDGNLASHLRTLEEVGYITANKQFINRKPNTSYSVTEDGKNAFKLHLDAFEKLFK
jgi:DNA-binding HxlR family transcriptional regulator